MTQRRLKVGDSRSDGNETAQRLAWVTAAAANRKVVASCQLSALN
jgi:hypothetical protein